MKTHIITTLTFLVLVTIMTYSQPDPATQPIGQDTSKLAAANLPALNEDVNMTSLETATDEMGGMILDEGRFAQTIDRYQSGYLLVLPLVALAYA